MRILYVTSSLPFGPVESFITPEIAALQRLGNDVHVVPMRPRGEIVHDDVSFMLDRTQRAPVLSSRIVRALFAHCLTSPGRAAHAFRSVLPFGRPRIAAKNLAVYPKGLWLARLTRELEVEHIHAHWGGATATMAMVAAGLADVPWSFTVHRWDIAEDNLLQIKTRSACFVRAISEDAALDLHQRTGGSSPPVILHMGVELPAFAEPAEAAHSPFKVVVPASLVAVKGHRVLLSATHELHRRGVQVEVDFAGDGPLRSELEQLVEGYGLTENVTFLGHVPHARLLSAFGDGAWDLVVLPSVATSREKEGIPVSLMEAMARAVPVLGTRVGAIPELLADGAGLIVEPGDPSLLAEQLKAIMQDDRLRLSVAAAGRDRVARFFSVDFVACELERLFEQCIATGQERAIAGVA